MTSATRTELTHRQRIIIRLGAILALAAVCALLLAAFSALTGAQGREDAAGARHASAEGRVAISQMALNLAEPDADRAPLKASIRAASTEERRLESLLVPAPVSEAFAAWVGWVALAAGVAGLGGLLTWPVARQDTWASI